MEPKKYIGEQIKNIRIKHKMSQSDLAHKLEVSDSIISGYERGARTPSIGVLLSMSKIFNVPISYFFNDEIENNYRLTVDVTDLTDNQLLIIGKLMDEFRELNKLNKKD